MPRLINAHTINSTHNPLETFQGFLGQLPLPSAQPSGFIIWLRENMSAAYELTREVHTLRLRRMLQAVNASVLPNQRGAYEQSLPRIAAILDKD